MAKTTLSFIAAAVAATFALSGCASEQSTATAANTRAILVSIDSGAETRLRNTFTAAEIPAFYEVFENGACAEFAQPSFPSVTAAGHSALWTGAYGNISNIYGNSAHPLPRNEHTVMASVSSYSSDNLSAEPIWISAGLQGLKVGGHHVTQAPRTPGFPAAIGERSSAQEAARNRVISGYEQANVIVMNGYNNQVQGDAVLSANDVEWQEQPWQNAAQLESGVSPRYFTFSNNAGTFYGAFYGTEYYDRIALNVQPNAEGAVVATAAPVENTPPHNRELARFFSEPLRIQHPEGALFMRARLFEASENGEDFLLFHTPMHIVETNHRDAQSEYENYVQGWFGNSATRQYSRGAFGPTFNQGGDGTAEARFLESAELETKLFNRGSSWFWNYQQTELLVDYFPLGDSIDHTLYAYLDTEYPGYNPEYAAKAQALRAATWALVDIRLEHLMALAEQDNAAVFVVGDHGMRASWMDFRPNVLLQEAGLQHLDENGMVDLRRSKAVSNNGNWITVNTTDWRGGIVPPEEKEAVISQIVAALEQLTDANGNPVISSVYRAAEHPELGLGGPAGGDVFWNLASGYEVSRRTDGGITNSARLWAGHTHAATDPSMGTISCAWGGGFTSKRIPFARQIDVAPTVSEYFGIEPPAHATGQSLLPQLKN